MKRLFFIFSLIGLWLSMVMALVGCKQTNENSTQVVTDTTNIWKVNQAINEFGEATGEKSIDAVISNGYFSNSATTQSPLTAGISVKWGVDNKGNKVPFVLLVLMEYNRHAVKDEGVLNISVKDNTGRVVRGKVLNEDNGAIQFNGKYYTMGSDIIYPILANGGTVKFHLETTSSPYSSYTFIIKNANGLKEALNKIK